MTIVVVVVVVAVVVVNGGGGGEVAFQILSSKFGWIDEVLLIVVVV